MILRSRRHRLRRIAAPDGQPVGTGWPYPDPPEFTPTQVDEQAARDKVGKVVSGLLPNAFDEATGHVPMNLINSWADQWIDEVDGEFDTYRHQVRREIGLAEAALAELDRLHDAETRRLGELSTARRNAFDELNAAPAQPGTANGQSLANASGPEPDEGGSDPGATPDPPQQPRSARRRPDQGYRAPSLVAGRPAGIFAHVAVLLVAAIADVGAFAQVVQLVMANQPGIVSFAVVIGLTVTVLYLAHSVGTMVRDRIAGIGAARWTWVVLATLGWASIGAVAFWVRLVITEADVQAPQVGLSTVDQPSTSDPVDATAMPAAVLFLALFIGSGLVAAIGAYVTHNPRAGEYRTVRSKHQSSSALAGEMAGVRTAVLKRLRHFKKALVKARRLRDRERRRRRHFAEELKQHARLLMADHVQDPAFSDALFTQDRLPYPEFRKGNGNTSQVNGNTSPGARE
ncbi:hypothetical protein [Actinophytocola sp.]|uniref:hypothetical protein n=1 Tax=Actinophytocola sp. TaxID=1872138 RepID=UPI002ED14113